MTGWIWKLSFPPASALLVLRILHVSLGGKKAGFMKYMGDGWIDWVVQEWHEWMGRAILFYGV